MSASGTKKPIQIFFNSGKLKDTLGKFFPPLHHFEWVANAIDYHPEILKRRQDYDGHSDQPSATKKALKLIQNILDKSIGAAALVRLGTCFIVLHRLYIKN